MEKESKTRKLAKKLRRFDYLGKIRKLKSYALFISMMCGILLCKVLTDMRWLTNLFMEDPGHEVDITPTTKYLLFLMLFITYSKVSPKQMKFEKMHIWLALTQWLGCWLVLAVLAPVNMSVACGAFICILISTATSAPVITGMLGGNVARLATYCIFVNLAIAIVAPTYFSLLGLGGEQGESSFVECFVSICKKVLPLALGPFILSIIVKKISKPVHEFFKTKQIISFWTWCIALVLLMAKTTSNILKKEDSNEYWIVFWVAMSGLGACLLQFYIGRKIGRKFGDAVVGGQSLGQKNTILAIWMAQTFFDNTYILVSIAPATYVLWQNLVNSWQMWRHTKQINAATQQANK